MQWGPQADAMLFMHVLGQQKGKLDYDALARSMGQGLTPKAITHRIAKLKANAAEYEQGNGGSNGVSASSEGKSSGKSDATPSKKRARKGNAAKPNGTDDDDDIDGGYVDGMEPGSKRLKTKHTGPSEDDTTPKMENDSE